MPEWQPLNRTAMPLPTLALNNFVEMRDKVADPKFPVAEKIEAGSAPNIPTNGYRLMPRSLFSPHIRYSEALRNGNRQERLCRMWCLCPISKDMGRWTGRTTYVTAYRHNRKLIMYSLPHFKEQDDDRILAFMRKNPFAVVIATGANGRPEATQVPLLIKTTESGRVNPDRACHEKNLTITPPYDMHGKHWWSLPGHMLM